MIAYILLTIIYLALIAPALQNPCVYHLNCRGWENLDSLYVYILSLLYIGAMAGYYQGGLLGMLLGAIVAIIVLPFYIVGVANIYHAFKKK